MDHQAEIEPVSVEEVISVQEKLARAKRRIAELEKALVFYADRRAWVYCINQCHLEIGVSGGKLTVPYPEVKFPALEDHGNTARAALKGK
jgi:hypothetical protein